MFDIDTEVLGALKANNSLREVEAEQDLSDAYTEVSRGLREAEKELDLFDTCNNAQESQSP